MSGDVFTAPRAPDKRKPPLPCSIPPETPPMIDPTSLRHARLTPNLREMIHGLNQQTPDVSNMHDLLASPDPAALYNSMQIGSPILRDLYPQQSPICTIPTSYENAAAAAERIERMAGACDEMNALFANYTHPINDIGSTSDSNDEAAISIMSSPEIGLASLDDTNACSSSDDSSKLAETPSTPLHHPSQSSSQTMLPVDTATSSASPATTPDLETVKPKPTSKQQHSSSKKTISSVKTDKPKKTAKRAPVKTQPKVAVLPQASLNAATIAATSAAMAMNNGMAGLMPFCTIPPGLAPHLMSAANPMQYQGRPMAFMPGAHGPELIPVDMIAQATALHYSAAQAAANQIMNAATAPSAANARRFPPLEPVGGSRKKRRRQMLERSGCTEEQARQNRAHALKRLREKKTLRSQKNTVRYACRKRIAMVRPRVNGRFATKEEVEESQREDQK